jgi:hypothetical protein
MGIFSSSFLIRHFKTDKEKAEPFSQPGIELALDSGTKAAPLDGSGTEDVLYFLFLIEMSQLHFPL